MTVEELYSDKNFLDDLRKGRYCLVLGAGFSKGLKNKSTPDSLSSIKDITYKEHETIPLVSAYISLTNKIFNETITKGEAAANIWENNNFSIKVDDNTIIDLKPFYRDLFTLDEEWFKENELNKYKSILIPDWYQVYTFNFDNVFETIVKLKSRHDFYSLHFPEHTGDTNRKTLQKAIHHLHGYIIETPTEKLTFGQATYVFLENAKHTLYDPFHADILSGKKLVIIGNQFDERNIDKMFFDGLKQKDITIYHFSRDNNDFKTKPGIYGNPNYHFIKINDTHEVLEFFEKHRTQIENIRIDGADVINSDFIEKVKQEGTKEAFTASDFYLAKQVDECQWYGVTQNWAVERDNYNYIKQEVISSIADEKRNSKISALVWGPGGSGKSTLLRQLAVDLSNEDFTVLWIKDKSIESFRDMGIAQLRSEYPHKRFLVVIEDLYRVKQQVANLKEIIDSICSNKNVRLIVGDRRIEDNSYKEHIYNPDKNIVEVTVDDNKKALQILLENIPDWKAAADKLLKTEDNYKSTLYYILWTIGRTALKEKEGFSLDPNPDLVSHFRSLVQSDLKVLSVNYPGVAKMLYYWASIYSKNKIYIAYDLFFKLADLFKTPSGNESKRILVSPSHKTILEIYSSKATGFIKSAGELSLFAFNHDILAEDGLSKSPLSVWHPFDDSIKLSMLPLVIQDGDDFSASTFLLHCLRTIHDTTFSKEEKKKSINQLLAWNNFSVYLSQVFTRDFYSSQEKSSIADKILAQDNFWKLDKEIVSTALNILKDKDKADKILAQDNFWKLDKEIVSTALNISKDKDKADKILAQDNFWNLPYQIVSTALNISKDKDKADKILAQDNFWNLPHQIVSTALNISKNEKIKNVVAKKLFESGQWKVKWSITYHILYFYSTQKNIPKPANQICETVITEYFNRTNTDKGKRYRYINLMKIPLHSLEVWKRSSLENIRRWENRQRNIVTNTILAYRSFPSGIKTMCELILRNWRTELTEPIYQASRRKALPHFGDHIRLSLGHPDLEKLAKQTALEIKKVELQSTGVIPEHLLNVVNQIIDENIFPVWNSENDDEQEKSST